MAEVVGETLPDSGGILARLFPRYSENRRLLYYVFGIVSTGLGILIWQGHGAVALLSWPFLWWLCFSLAAEFLWLETTSGAATESMATTTNLGVLCLWPLGLSLWIVAVSVVLATRYIQKRDAVRTLFSLGQMVWTAFLSGGARMQQHPGPTTTESFRSPMTALAILVAAGTYFFVNTFLVTGAVSLERGLPFWETWRNNYAYRNSVISSVALFSLSPLLIVAFLGVGYVGVLFFFLPLLIIKNQNLEHIKLQKMHQQMIATERLAAAGEMARRVAHDINNFLMAISGRTQLLQAKAQRIGETSMTNDATLIQEQVHLMSSLAKDLLDFTPKETQLAAADLNKLVTKAVDFVRASRVFADVALEMQLDPECGEVDCDSDQMHRVLSNLLKNSAEAMLDAKDGRTEPARIVTRTARAPQGLVRIEVADNGPGMSRAIQEKVFQASFTTKKSGHGLGLATCQRILQNHGGRLWVESEPGKGANFILEFPKRSKSSTTKSNSEAKGSNAIRADGAIEPHGDSREPERGAA